MNKEQFIEELAKINIQISSSQLNQLSVYYNLLIEENKKYNLTAITEENEVYLKHFYDSLTSLNLLILPINTFVMLVPEQAFQEWLLKFCFQIQK